MNDTRPVRPSEQLDWERLAEYLRRELGVRIRSPRGVDLMDAGLPLALSEGVVGRGLSFYKTAVERELEEARVQVRTAQQRAAGHLGRVGRIGRADVARRIQPIGTVASMPTLLPHHGAREA